MCTVLLLIINLCTIMQDSKHRAIIQTIHTNVISWVCSVTQAVSPLIQVKCMCNFSKSLVTVCSLYLVKNLIPNCHPFFKLILFPTACCYGLDV